MRINDLLVVRAPDTALNTAEINGTIYQFPVAILQLKNGKYTWRGEGQVLPRKGTLVAIASIIFAGDSDQNEEWPLQVQPIAIDLNGSTHYFGNQVQWELLDFEPHDIEWHSNGNGRLIAAQFVHDGG